jgi:hypothetical protein
MAAEWRQKVLLNLGNKLRVLVCVVISSEIVARGHPASRAYAARCRFNARHRLADGCRIESYQLNLRSRRGGSS